jgi:hypothetical protein
VNQAAPFVAVLGLLLLGATTKPKPRPKGHHPKAHARLRKAPKLSHAPGSAAERYAALSPSACLAELTSRGIPFTREPAARGVQIPVRLEGKVGGVLYRTDFPDRERSKVPWEVFDCRLVLSLSDFGAVLRAHEIVEARIFSCWRPPAKGWPMTEWGRRHEGALAVDVRELRKDNGEALNVLEQFHGKVGAPPCGVGSVPPSPESPGATELREIACAAADSHVFNSVLTPNYDPPHKNHFHLELTPDVDWFMVR